MEHDAEAKLVEALSPQGRGIGSSSLSRVTKFEPGHCAGLYHEEQMMKTFEACAFEDQRHLSVLYGQPHRFYHNGDHAHHVAMYCKQIWAKYGNANEVPVRFFDIAAAFHDAYYDLDRKDNELRSALLFDTSASADPKYCGFHRRGIYQTILATASHCDPANDELCLEGQIFLDADLYELGAEWELFEHNSKNLELEYRTAYSEEDFLNGRKAWLENVLAKDKIFWVVKDRDIRAFKNVARSLAELNKRLI